MKFFVGTSGYNYRPWKGEFYPAELPDRQMLSYYSGQLATVELNGTAYRFPTAKDAESWAAQVPAAFRFAIKAPQSITHRGRLIGVESQVSDLIANLSPLKRRLGPLLVQLPPNFKQDLPRLDAFLKLLGKKSKTACEFRHPSWFDEEVYACLREHKCALCAADADDTPAVELVRTADWGYLRLRRERYTDKQLRDWIKRIAAQKWREAYVYFKHEDAGAGPKLAARLIKLATAVGSPNG